MSASIPNLPSPKMFAVLGQLDNAETLGNAIKQKFPEAHYPLANNTWIVIADSTAKGISDQLGITDGSIGAGVVLLFTSYYGRASTQLWEWVASKMGTPHG